MIELICLPCRCVLLLCTCHTDICFTCGSDAPPALAKLSSQVAALTTKPTVSSPGVPNVTAAVTIKYTDASQPKPLKSGFFDARKAQNKSQSSKVCLFQQIAHLLHSSYDISLCCHRRALEPHFHILKLIKALLCQATF